MKIPAFWDHILSFRRSDMELC